MGATLAASSRRALGVSAPLLKAQQPGLLQARQATWRQFSSSSATSEASASSSGKASAKPTLESLEQRIEALEAKYTAQATKLGEVEQTAKKKGGLMQMITQYGAPFALWYGFCWAGCWFAIYMLLETGIVSWQDSLRPFFAGLGLDSYCDRVDPSMGNAVIA